MNQDIAYQNPDLDNQNPLIPTEPINPNNQSPEKKLSLPKDPKVKIAFILGIITVILLITSFILTSIKKSVIITTPNPKPSPINTPAPTGPDGTGYSEIPDSYKEKFKNVDQLIQTNIDFNPPQITDDVGR